MAGLLWSHARSNRRGIVVFKLLASCSFLGLGLELFDASKGHHHGILIAALLGVIGDVLLSLETRRAVLIGIITFLVGHAAYIAAFYQLIPSHHVTLDHPPTLWTIAGTLIFMLMTSLLLIPQLSKLKGLVTGYLLVIHMMVGTAILAASSHSDKPINWLIAFGALLFAVSDLFVAKNRFIKKSLINRLWGLPLYYAGQFLLVSSMALTF